MGAAEEWMSPPDYGHSLKGMGVNLLVRAIAQSLPFYREVLRAKVLYADDAFAALSYEGCEWMLHADETYHANPLLELLPENPPRGLGVELRLYGLDPDAAEERAIAGGYQVLQTSQAKPHGLRECFLMDPDGYVWAPGVKA